MTRRRPVDGQTAMDAAPEWSEAPGQIHLSDLMDDDPDAPDDGLVLVAGVLYDRETGHEAGEGARP